MVRGGRNRTVFTFVGRGSASPSTTGTASPSTSVVPVTGTASPSMPVVPVTGTASPSTTRVAPPFPSSSPPEVESQHPAADEEGPQLPGRQPYWISGGKIDPGSASRYITTLVHAHIPGLVDAWREIPRYTFTRPEDLPRARAVWESTTQTNLRDATDQLIRRRMCILHHELERAPTFHELFDRTHKRKGTDDYVSESARTIAETYDRMMADRYVEGTPHPDLDPEAWVTQREGRGRVECTALGTAWILLQCYPHMRVRSLLRHTRVHLLCRPSVV
ncbi:hypothetical protein Taro_040728 [Colocasia esculenta]|uniref:Uncharacterized protein n=1 Tax=Colocasia esculenta TaxID=4460 RepID=A0A843WJR0_COLES|nr:hypothetical protein [Colocasia esculenta]